MRVVLDTNIVVSGSLYRGAPSRVLDAARSKLIDSWTSMEIIQELFDTLNKPKFVRHFIQKGLSVGSMVLEFAQLNNICPSIVVLPVILADPDNDVVLATAVAASADAIVTGDHHLLALGQYQGIEILTTVQLLQKLGLP